MIEDQLLAIDNGTQSVRALLFDLMEHCWRKAVWFCRNTLHPHQE